MKWFIPVMLFALVGCAPAPPIWSVTESEKVDNIVMVFMNSPSDYTVYTKANKEDKEIKPVSLQTWPSSRRLKIEAKIIVDVPDGQPMYAIKKTYKNEAYGGRTGEHESKIKIEIHIRNINVLQGGQWSYRTGGKFPKTISGRVTRIAFLSRKELVL